MLPHRSLTDILVMLTVVRPNGRVVAGLQCALTAFTVNIIQEDGQRLIGSKLWIVGLDCSPCPGQTQLTARNLGIEGI